MKHKSGVCGGRLGCIKIEDDRKIAQDVMG
jgi:hypothetical protein